MSRNKLIVVRFLTNYKNVKQAPQNGVDLDWMLLKMGLILKYSSQNEGNFGRRDNIVISSKISFVYNTKCSNGTLLSSLIVPYGPSSR